MWRSAIQPTNFESATRAGVVILRSARLEAAPGPIASVGAAAVLAALASAPAPTVAAAAAESAAEARDVGLVDLVGQILAEARRQLVQAPVAQLAEARPHRFGIAARTALVAHLVAQVLHLLPLEDVHV